MKVLIQSNALKAQGTIEYLVIIAVVVVLSLVVVSLMTTIFSSPANQITSTAGKISSMTGSITIIDSATDSTGKTIVRVKNNSGENISLTKVTLNGVENAFFENINLNDAKTLSLNSLTNCINENKTYVVKIYYTTQNGLTKEINLGEMKIDCTEEITTPPNVIPTTSCFSIGTGALSSPKIICDCNDLQNINQHLDWNYELGTDINCSLTKTWNGGKGFDPINTFTGNLDGKTHTVYSLFSNHNYLDPIRWSTLFTEISSSGSISNLNLSDLNWIGEESAGIAYVNSGTITNCSVAGTLLIEDEAGAFVSRNDGGTIRNSTSNVTILQPITASEANIGGFVSYNRGDIYNSVAMGKAIIYYSGVQGGFAGVNDRGGHIYNSSSSVDINILPTGSNIIMGGFVGQNFETIDNSFTSGNISLAENYYSIIGGFAGYNVISSSAGTITNSYSAGSIYCSNLCTDGMIGGFIGENRGALVNTFSATRLTLPVAFPKKSGFAATLTDTWSITNSYYDINKTGIATCCSIACTGCTGKNNANTQPTYFFDGNNSPMGPKPTSWDFTTIWNDNNTVLQYPTLK